MPPFFAAILAAVLTIGFFAFFHAKVKNLWLRNIFIVLGAVVSLGIGGVLTDSSEAAELSGQIYGGLIVISYLGWKFILKRIFAKKEAKRVGRTDGP